SSSSRFLVSQGAVKKPKTLSLEDKAMKIERAHRRTHKPTVQEYRFKEAQLVVRDNPSLPVEIEALAGVQFIEFRACAAVPVPSTTSKWRVHESGVCLRRFTHGGEARRETGHSSGARIARSLRAQ
ncbi:MAG: hypothetical protein P8Z74_18460, partial [Acidobacteriota bacterium]